MRHLFLLSSIGVASGFTIPSGSGASSFTRLYSIPSSLDTFSSGLASISRLPRGITVTTDGISLIGPAAPYLPKIKQLYDVENSRECRTVRERITEYDLVVEQMIPTAQNSRAMAKGSIMVPTMVAEIDGKEQTFTGVDDIMAFLDEKFSIVKKDEAKNNVAVEEEVNDPLKVVLDKCIELASFIPGVLRAGRGSSVCSAASMSFDVPRPAKPLILYSYEGNQFCRLVREVLTELDIVYELRSAGKMSPRREELAEITGGFSQCPYLIDPNTGIKMAESKDIVAYLYKTYAMWTPPNELLQSASSIITPLLAPLYKVIAPLQAGSYKENEFEYTSEIAEAKASIYDDIASNPVVLYTYELSPFCMEAKACLENCGITFKEVSLGLEWIPGLIKDPAKRAALLDMTGQSSLPHIFIGGESIGGLFSGSPGLVPALEKGLLSEVVDDAKKAN